MKKKPTNRQSSKTRPWLWRLLITMLVIVLVVSSIWVLYLNYRVTSKFEGHKWSMPAQVYTQPMLLYSGADLSLNEVMDELKSLDYQWVEKVQLPGQAAHRGDSLELITRESRLWDKLEPVRHISLNFSGSQLRRLQVIDGDVTRLVRLEPRMIGAISPRHSELRELVKLEEITPLLGESLLAVEDRQFLNHHGIAPLAIARAFWINLRAGRVVQGGSTITQQLVKNFYLTNERSLLRKAQEVVMALLLEWHYSKHQILETYINEVYLGQSGPLGVHGFGLAARHYFGKSAKDLSVADTALLVGLVKGASFYNPWRNPQRAKERRDVVLGVMRDQGLITSAQYQQASRSSLNVVPYARRKLQNYPAFLDLVRRQLQQDYSDDTLSSEGLSIFTTLVPRVQQQAEQALTRRLPKLEKDYGLALDTLQAGLVITDVGSGSILAMVGDRQPQFAGFNRALDTRRPIGSLIKPAVFLAAHQSGTYHWASLIDDSPVTVTAENGTLWEPRNFTRESHDNVLMIDALIHSYNQATARLGMEVGLEKVHAAIVTLLSDAMASQVPAYPSILLGSVSLSPYDVAGMYHTLANDGVKTPLRAIQAVTNATGEVMSRYPLQIEPVMTPAQAYLLQYGLLSVMQQGTGRGAYQSLDKNLSLAGKTGTTNDQRDSWFAGFGDNFLSVVWIGRDDNGQTPLTGSSGALKVWADIMQALPVKGFVPAAEKDVIALWVDSKTGALSGENCQNAILLPFIKGNEPTETGPCSNTGTRLRKWFEKLF